MEQAESSMAANSWGDTPWIEMLTTPTRWRLCCGPWIVTPRISLSPWTNRSVSCHPDILADLNLTADDTTRLVEFASSEGGFELLLGRDWHEMIDREDVSVLRLVNRGDLIAQCNISALPSMEDGVPFTLIDFQQDVKNALDKSFGDFVTSSEEVNDHGLHVMRVVASGMISDLSINWVYYHITNNQGLRASCVFTCEAELADRFGAIDQSVISSFRFRDKN